MLVSSRFPKARVAPLAAIAAAATALSLEFSAGMSSASIVFESDFSGVSSGQITGTTGGTATLTSKSTDPASVGTSSPFTASSGGYLMVSQTSGESPGAGATISPSNIGSDTGFNSWFSQTGSGPGGADNTINGAFDFNYKTNVASTDWVGSTVRIMDPNWGSTGIRLFLISPAANTLQLGFLTQPSADYGHFYLTDSAVNINAGSLYHIAVTVSTNPTTGDLAGKLYIVSGNTTITTSGLNATTPVASTSTTPFTDPVTNGFGTSQFLFGQEAYGSTAPTTITEQFDTFRIYNTVPTTFAALPTPEPAALGLLTVGGGLLLLGRRRKIA